jgi:hypothetical protein
MYTTVSCALESGVFFSLIQFTFTWREIYRKNNNKPTDFLPATSNGERHRTSQSYIKWLRFYTKENLSFPKVVRSRYLQKQQIWVSYKMISLH